MNSSCYLQDCIVKTGYLVKSPPLESKYKRWHKRYFVLYDLKLGNVPGNGSLERSTGKTNENLSKRIRRSFRVTSKKKELRKENYSSVESNNNGHVEDLGEDSEIVLCYYENEEKAKKGNVPKGKILCSKATVYENQFGKNGYDNIINLKTGNRLFHLCAETAEEHRAWLRTFRNYYDDSGMFFKTPKRKFSKDSVEEFLQRDSTKAHLPRLDANSPLQELYSWRKNGGQEEANDSVVEEDFISRNDINEFSTTDKKDSGYSDTSTHSRCSKSSVDDSIYTSSHLSMGLGNFRAEINDQLCQMNLDPITDSIYCEPTSHRQSDTSSRKSETSSRQSEVSTSEPVKPHRDSNAQEVYDYLILKNARRKTSSKTSSKGSTTSPVVHKEDLYDTPSSALSSSQRFPELTVRLQPGCEPNFEIYDTVPNQRSPGYANDNKSRGYVNDDGPRSLKPKYDVREQKDYIQNFDDGGEYVLPSCSIPKSFSNSNFEQCNYLVPNNAESAKNFANKNFDNREDYVVPTSSPKATKEFSGVFHQKNSRIADFYDVVPANSGSLQSRSQTLPIKKRSKSVKNEKSDVNYINEDLHRQMSSDMLNYQNQGETTQFSNVEIKIKLNENSKKEPEISLISRGNKPKIAPKPASLQINQYKSPTETQEPSLPPREANHYKSPAMSHYKSPTASPYQAPMSVVHVPPPAHKRDEKTIKPTKPYAVTEFIGNRNNDYMNQSPAVSPQAGSAISPPRSPFYPYDAVVDEVFVRVDDEGRIERTPQEQAPTKEGYVQMNASPNTSTDLTPTIPVKTRNKSSSTATRSGKETNSNNRYMNDGLPSAPDRNYVTIGGSSQPEDRSALMKSDCKQFRGPNLNKGKTKNRAMTMA